MIDLARRSGDIQSIAVHEVYANDLFKLKYGLEDTLEHIPWDLREDKQFVEPGTVRGFYAVFKFKSGGYYIHFMSVAEVEQHRKRSRAADSGPWKSDFIEMGKKTVIRAAWKYLPISIEDMRRVEASDETVKTEVAEDMTEVPNIITPEYTVTDETAEQPTEEGATDGQTKIL